MNIDHLVLWVSDQKRSLDLFVNVVGLEGGEGGGIAGSRSVIPCSGG